MPEYNDLGYYIKSNLRNYWNKSATECYLIGMRCYLCSMPDDLKEKCQMKASVLEMVRRYGKPNNNLESEEE